MTVSRAPILVLGATGQVGQLLQGVWPEDAPVLWHSRSARDGFQIGDLLSEPERIADMAGGCQAILCLPGVTDKRHRKSGQDYTDNGRLAQAAILAAQKAGCGRVLLCSSAAVYGRSADLCTEDHTGVDVSLYGLAKREMEATGTALGQATGVSVCSLRIGNLAGADAILGGWQHGFELDTFRDGSTPVRSYLGLRALARIVIDLAQSDTLPPILNVAQPGVVSMGDLLDAAARGWQARPAPASAIKTVALSLDLLQKTVTQSVPATSARALADEWARHPSRAEYAQ